MTRQELISAISEKSEVSKKKVDDVLKAFVDVVTDDVAAGNKVQLYGFGTFESVDRLEHKGRNPLTKEEITIAASRSPKFKASSIFKEKVKA